MLSSNAKQLEKVKLDEHMKHYANYYKGQIDLLTLARDVNDDMSRDVIQWLRDMRNGCWWTLCLAHDEQWSKGYKDGINRLCELVGM